VKESLRFIGIDFETTGLSVTSGHVPIQVGIASFNHAETGPPIPWVSTMIGWQPGSYQCDPIAMGVHGFTPRDFDLDVAPPRREVDELCCEALAPISDTFSGSALIPVGWNVGSFDMVFCAAHLPKLRSRFGHRAFDLNSACFAIAGADADAMKAELKRYASDLSYSNGDTPRPHHAGWDAWEALVCARRIWSMVENRQVDPTVAWGS
jgi:DNA polymerase III epsilon subunit-like protein